MKQQTSAATETRIKGNTIIDFTGKTLYVGIDVHQKDYQVAIVHEDICLGNHRMPADSKKLIWHLQSRYPGATLKCVYESSAWGFNLQRHLSAAGIDCIVVNAADVPSSDKDRKRKDDKRDARKLSIELSKGNLESIYIPDKEMQAARTLVRQRYRLVQDQTRCKNRIKHLLMSNGISIADANQHWSLKSISKIQQSKFESSLLKASVDFAIEQYLQIRRILKEITMAIRNISKEEPFLKVQKFLQSVGGIGMITGMVIQTEIGDINRFKRFDSLCDYVGFVPDIYSSNDKTIVRGMSQRGNSFLKETIIESSWVLIRKDPAMLMKYNEYRSRMSANKAIIRIAKHLLSRIRFLWKNEQLYVKGLVK